MKCTRCEYTHAPWPVSFQPQTPTPLTNESSEGFRYVCAAVDFPRVFPNQRPRGLYRRHKSFPVTVLLAPHYRNFPSRIKSTESCSPYVHAVSLLHVFLVVHPVTHQVAHTSPPHLSPHREKRFTIYSQQGAPSCKTSFSRHPVPRPCFFLKPL